MLLVAALMCHRGSSNSYDRDRKAHKAEHVYYTALCRKSLLSPVLEDPCLRFISDSRSPLGWGKECATEPCREGRWIHIRKAPTGSFGVKPLGHREPLKLVPGSEKSVLRLNRASVGGRAWMERTSETRRPVVRNNGWGLEVRNA